jgi:hypothetical protein
MVDMECLVAFLGRPDAKMDACLEKMETWLGKMEAYPERAEAN